jgi:guanylate kinase
MSSDLGVVPGLLVVVSAPSGTGKTTVVERLVQRRPSIARSRSVTSRPPRAGEVDGVDYTFVTRDAFQAMVTAGEFLEWATIFGNLYGTTRRSVEATMAQGTDVVLVIDVQGSRQIRETLPRTVGIFVLPPSYTALEHRLRGRNQDSSGSIEARLATAREEILAVSDYEYVVVNDGLERCVGEIDAILTAEHARLDRRRSLVDPILETFRERRP